MTSERPGLAPSARLVDGARAIAFASRRLERALGEMTLPQFRVLALVASSRERASRVAEWAAVSRPSLTGLLDGLEARAWLRRVEVAGDRRGVLLEVTPAGAAALAAAEASMAGALADLAEAAGDLAGEPTGGAGGAERLLDGLDVLGAVLRAGRLRRPAAAPR
ncbi:MAG TPA: MarR family transcriptional regulator [Acidimicrobiales bacterium]